MSSKKIAFEFQGVDSGVSTMITKLRQQSKQMGTELAGDAIKYSKASKEQLSYIEETIKAIQRRNALDQKQGEFAAKRRYEAGSNLASNPLEKQKVEERYKADMANLSGSGDSDRIQIDLLRELIETTKLTAKEEIAANKEAVVKNIKEVERKVARGEDVDQIELLKANIQKDILHEDKKEEQKNGPGMFQSLLGFELFKQITGAIQQMPTARNEMDMIQPGMGILGAGVGSGVGYLAELAHGMQVEFTQLGAEIGRQVGDFTGASLKRSFEERDKLFTQEGVNKGLTGQTRVNRGFYNSLVGYGMDYSETAGLTEEVLRSRGNINGLNSSVKDAAGLRFAYGLDQGDIMSQFRQERLTGGRAGDNVVNTLKDAIREGVLSEGDRTLLGELLQNQNQVVQMFGKSSITPSSESANAAMLNLNKFGGSFSMRDPRFMDRFGSIQGALTNPGNDFSSALSFQALRNTPGMENASMLELLKAQEKGMQTEGYMDSYIDLLSQGGGNDEFKTLDLASTFGLSIEDAEQMFKGRGKGTIGKGNMSKLTNQTRAIRDESRGNVSPLAISSAEITNSFVDGFGHGIMEVSEKFLKAMGMSIDEIAKQFTDSIKKSIKDTPKPPKGHDANMN